MVANAPATHIHIFGSLIVSQGAADYECVAFANEGRVAVSSATFKLLFFSPSHGDAGSQEVTVSSTVAPGERMNVPTAEHPGDASQLPNCKPLTVAKEKIFMTFLAPDSLEYADGTSWRLSKASPSPSPSPSATP